MSTYGQHRTMAIRVDLVLCGTYLRERDPRCVHGNKDGVVIDLRHWYRVNLPCSKLVDLLAGV